MSGFEYDVVIKLKIIITTMLDGFIDGDDIDDIIEKSKNTQKGIRSNVKSKCKLFSCESCNFQTKLGSVLKTHKARIHKQQSSFSCPFCDHKCKEKNELEEHKQVEHTSKTTFDCNICDFKAIEQCDFEEHQEKHKQ